MSDRNQATIDVMVIDNFEPGKKWSDQPGVKIEDVAHADVVIGRVVYEDGSPDHWFLIKNRDDDPENFRFLRVDTKDWS